MTAYPGAPPARPPRRSPLLALLAFYVLLGATAFLLVRLVPALGGFFSLEHLSALGESGRGLAGQLGAETAARTPPIGVAVLSMVGALLLMVPVVWVYTLTKRRQGYDQSVVQTMFLLPITVAGVMFVVQHSIALAFALAAIVAAVRFRNTLKDTKDTVYIFLAIGVGLAAGTQALVLGAVMSVMFNAVVLALWRFNVGNIYAEHARAAPLRPGEALFGPGRGEPSLAVGDPALLEALAPEEIEELAARAARLEAYVAARAADRKKKRFTGVVLVHAARVAPAQEAAEAVLEEHAKRWRLAEIVPAAAGKTTLEYLVRLEEDALAATLLDALKARGQPHVLAVEFKSLKGLKQKE